MANCLICCRVVVSDDDEEKSRKISQFRQGLQLFCKLLEINGNHVDKILSDGEEGNGESGVVIGPPCCKECLVAFEQMLRIQQAIDLMQATLMEQLDKLKVALQSSDVPSDYEEDPLKIPPDDILGKIRDQLLSCVRNSTTSSSLTSDRPPRKKRKQTLTKSPKQPTSVLARKGKEYRPCSVILERLPVNLLNSMLSPEKGSPDDITIKQEINASFNEPYGDGGGGRRSPRKSKLKAFEFIQKNSSPKESRSSAAIVKIDRCTLNDEDYMPSPEAPPSQIQSNDDDDEDEYPWESEAGPIFEPLPTPTNTTYGTRRLSKFSLISPDTLLYQYTLIKVSQGYTHFTCQEPQCPSPHFSDTSLNWNSLFQQIAHHIKNIHSIVPSPSKDNLRNCPLCPATLPPGYPFRAHLISTFQKHEGHHRIDTVACEICWRPIRNLADAYKCHLWHHKNSQEKVKCPEGPPSTIVSKSNHKLKRNQNKVIKKSGKLLLKRKKPKFVPKVKENLASPSVTKVKDDRCDLNGQHSVPSPFPGNHDNDHDDDDDEAKPIPEDTLQNQGNSTCGTSRVSKFSLISPDTLLYQYTLIKVSQGYTHFTCQEPECPSPHFSDCSLNWNSLFNQIADHIENVHSAPSPSSSPQNGLEERKCPLCPAILPAGHLFSAHLISTQQKHKGHRIETVACEICWRPIRNMSDAYKCHLWLHKNDQEKEQCLEGPPTTILAKAKCNKKLKRKLDQIFGNSGKQFLKREKPKPNIVPKPKKKGTKPKFKEKLKTIKLKKRSSPNQNTGNLQVGDHFSQILEENSRESLLLYKYTLLKASYGVSLSCQESNCDHVINGTDFTAFEEFKDHVKKFHAISKCDTTWECLLCSEHLETANAFRRHLLHHCPGVSSKNNKCMFICTVCWKPMNSVATLEYHQWLHKNETEKESVLSNKAGATPTLVKIRENGRVNKLKCGHCEREFDAVANLKAHEATHVPTEERKKYMCHQCPRLFLSAVAVRGHVERAHQKELMRKRSCPICNKEYNWRDGYKFRTHVRSHKDERNWICDKCGMGFLNTVALKGHTERVHGDDRERRFQCEFCEMNYLRRKNLTRHRKSAHKDEVGVEEDEDEKQKRLKFVLPEYRPDFIGPKIAFPCPVCEKVFQLKSRMKKHWENSCKNKL